MTDWSIVWLLCVFASVSWALAEALRRMLAEERAEFLSEQLRQANAEVERLLWRSERR